MRSSVGLARVPRCAQLAHIELQLVAIHQITAIPLGSTMTSRAAVISEFMIDYLALLSALQQPGCFPPEFPMNPLSRRAFLGHYAGGIGALALTQLLQSTVVAAESGTAKPKARAKSVICLF